MLNITNLKFNPFTPMNDLEDRISPYNINTIPGKQVMRIEKNINEGLKVDSMPNLPRRIKFGRNGEM